MFPFHHSCELSFQNPNNEVEQQPFHSSTTPTHSFYLNQDISNNIPNYKYNNYHAQILNNDDDNTIIRSPKSRKRGASRSLVTTNIEVITNKNKRNKVDQDGIFENDVSMKRSIHRDVERQRRQDMSNLYSSLRSLLPMEYIKGKRSISDHVSEAAKYIRVLEKSVEELGDIREKLKVSSSSSSSSPSLGDQNGCGSSSSTHPPSIISYGGRNNDFINVSFHTLSSSLIQVEIIVGFGEEELPVLPLSRVLKLMFEQRFNVVSSISSKVNQKWIYVIHFEVNDVASINLQDLERKLMSS